MAIKKQVCAFHPERHAIGVCVITKRPICAECSTRYEGVNYSKEGLRILKEQRTAAMGQSQKSHRVVTLLSVLTAPLLFYMVILFHRLAMKSLIDLQQFSFLD